MSCDIRNCNRKKFQEMTTGTYTLLLYLFHRILHIRNKILNSIGYEKHKNYLFRILIREKNWFSKCLNEENVTRKNVSHLMWKLNI